jgi:hypothetical protein
MSSVCLLRHPAVAYLFLVRPMSAWDDWRFGIWNALHDGEITVVARDEPDSLIVFVSIPYVRRRIEPLGDSFRLRLAGFRGMHFDNGIGDSYSELEDIEGLEILETKSDKMPAEIQCAQGTLTLDYDSLEISLDSGQPISPEEVYRAYQEYWDEWSKKTQQV